MNLSHAHTPTWRGTWNIVSRCTAQAQRPLTCFQCGKEGHFTQNCPQHCLGASAAYALDYDSSEEMLLEELESTIAHIKAELKAMSVEDKARLAQEMGSSSDFQEA